MIANGEHVYSFIGISGLELNNTMREGLGVGNTQRGAYITDVRPGTPAQEAGLRDESGSFDQNGNSVNAQYDGDLIVAVDGRPVESMDDLIAYLALNTAPGDDIVVGIFRDGVEIAIPMTLGARPATS